MTTLAELNLKLSDTFDNIRNDFRAYHIRIVELQGHIDIMKQKILELEKENEKLIKGGIGEHKNRKARQNR
ncbi:MAG: hypothetical protein WC998_02850 [Candidatus Paceibacterota bacterium]|jgi:hypothetical protein